MRLRRALHNPEGFINHPRYPLLFDPQTAGGLFASIPESALEACLQALHELQVTPPPPKLVGFATGGGTWSQLNYMLSDNYVLPD